MLLTTRHRLVKEITAEQEKRRNMDEAKQEQIKATWEDLRNRGFGFAKNVLPPAILNYDKGQMLHQVLFHMLCT